MSWNARFRAAGKYAASWALPLVQGTVYGYVFANYCCSITHCWGPSMHPTIQFRGTQSTQALVSHLTWLTGYRVGNVVLCWKPGINGRPPRLVCKRVIGMGGDTLRVPLCGAAAPGNHIERVVIVPKDHVWLSGDNIGYSIDSRDYGPLPQSLLSGVVFLKFWPPREMGFIRQDLPEHVQRAYRVASGYAK